MKRLLVLWVMLSASAAMAAPSASRGYLAESRDGTLAYFGITDSQVDVQLPLHYFSEEKVDSMNKCMEKRETHAILVEMETRARRAPGMPSAFHEIVVTAVTCVKAPGFIHVWRRFFN